MEIRINQEIRGIREHLFLGLTVRQCVCGALAVMAGAAAFMLTRGRLGTELASWCSVAAAAPGAFAGFAKIAGMKPEEWIAAVLRLAVTPDRLLFREENRFYMWLEPERRERRRHEA